MTSLSTAWQPRLLERERELGELDAAMRAARGCDGRTVCIEAAAGLGKTRLLRRLRERGGRVGMRVVAARGTELEREFPYGVVRQLLEPVLAGLGQSERAALFQGAAAGARPVLEPEPGRAVLGPGAAEDLSFSMLYGLYWLIANLSQAGPLLLAVDDAHWADLPSGQFLRFLSTRLEGLPILVAVASRPLDHASPFAALRNDPGTLVITPGPLGHDSVATLLGVALRSPPDAAFSAACHTLTGGNPFLLTELARKLAAEAVQPTARDASIVRRLVPEAILRSVLQRLALLDAPARELARAVAILGDGCEPRSAAALAEMDPDRAAEAADALRSMDILEPEPPLRFVHPLVRNAVYADIPAGARSREHVRAAAMLTADGVSAERIAIHLLATDPAGDAAVVETLRKAAQAALDQGAPQPANAYLTRAMREPPPEDARADILVLLNEVGLRVADTSAFAPFESEALATLMSDPERAVGSAEGLGLFLMTTGRVEEGASVLERGIKAAEEVGELGVAVALGTQLISFTQLSPTEARARFSCYDGRLNEGSPEKRLVLALRSWWNNLSGGRACETADLAKRALAGGHIAKLQVDSVCCGQAILVLIRADELEAAEDAAERLIAAGTEQGAAAVLAVGWYTRAAVALRRGDLNRAEADARQATDLTRLRSFNVVGHQIGTRMLIDVLVERDELEAAERELKAAGAHGEIADGYLLWPVLFSRARLRAAQGRAPESAADLLELRARMGKWGLTCTPGLLVGAYAGRALASAGDREQARTLAREQLENARHWGAPSGIAESLAALGVIEGGARGIELLHEAVALLEPAPTRLVHAATLTDLGSLMRRERRPGDAREPLREALDIARRCGGIAVARRAAHELKATGEKVQRYAPIGVESLTASERRVAEMAARGMTNREIAAALYVTIKTVESHLSATYDKLGIRARSALKPALDGAHPIQPEQVAGVG